MAKLVPSPSQVAPSGYGSPGQTVIAPPQIHGGRIPTTHAIRHLGALADRTLACFLQLPNRRADGRRCPSAASVPDPPRCQELHSIARTLAALDAPPAVQPAFHLPRRDRARRLPRRAGGVRPLRLALPAGAA